MWRSIDIISLYVIYTYLLIDAYFLVYADMDDENCNSLDFMFSAAGIDATIPNTRQWSIKVFVINDNA